MIVLGKKQMRGQFGPLNATGLSPVETPKASVCSSLFRVVSLVFVTSVIVACSSRVHVAATGSDLTRPTISRTSAGVHLASPEAAGAGSEACRILPSTEVDRVFGQTVNGPYSSGGVGALTQCIYIDAQAGSVTASVYRGVSSLAFTDQTYGGIPLPAQYKVMMARLGDQSTVWRLSSTGASLALRENTTAVDLTVVLGGGARHLNAVQLVYALGSYVEKHL
jgi:hypothetical protein